MADADFILFSGPATWRIARRGDAPAWLEVDAASDIEATAAAVAAALREQGYTGRPVVLALPSEDCLVVRVPTAGLPKSDRRALSYRLEEQLPLAAEDVVADFTSPAGGDALAVCVILAALKPTVDALEAAGVSVRSIVPAALAAAQSPACLNDEDEHDAVVHLIAEPADAGRLSVVTRHDGRVVDWALLPATASDVRLHIDLVSADLQISPRVRSFGLSDSVSDAVEAAIGCVVHRQTGDAADAAADFGADVLSGHATPWFDLRRDALAATDRLRHHRRPLNFALAGTAVLLLALTIATFARSASYARSAQRDKAALVAEFREHFSSWVVPTDVRAVVAAEHRKALAATAAPTGGEAAYGSALRTLRDVLSGLPEGNRFALSTLSVQDTSLTLTGKMAAFEQGDAIAAAARKSGMDVPPPQTRRTPDGTWAFVVQGIRATEPAGQTAAVPR